MPNNLSLTVRLDRAMALRLSSYQTEHPDLSGAAIAVAALNKFLPTVSADSKGSFNSPRGGRQDAVSGKAGRDFGVSAGRALAAKLGKIAHPTANEIILPDGRRATVRTAKGSNTQWGCLNSIRDRVDTIFCAYTKDGENFEVWEVSTKVWKSHGRDASSGHRLKGKLTLLGKSDIRRHGSEYGMYSI